MKRAAALLALQLIAFPLLAANEVPSCTLCVGIASPEVLPAATPVPQLIRTTEGEFGTSAAATMPQASREKAIVVVSATIGGDEPLTDADRAARAIVESARQFGPFNTLALDFTHSDPAVAAYAIKRAAVAAQGLNVAQRLALAPTSLERLARLFEHGAQAYFDVLLVEGGTVQDAAVWLAQNDPAKKIFAIVRPVSPNPLFDAARALADGATLALLESDVDSEAVANVNRALAGDFAFDSTSKPSILDSRGVATETPALVFVRGEDLRSVVVPAGASKEMPLSTGTPSS